MSSIQGYKGKYYPKNPSKYKGDPTVCIYRSLWERRVMEWLDLNENVVEWSSEERIIHYKSPVDNRAHRYFPDFLATVKRPDGTLRTSLIEIKPYKQTQPPKKKKTITREYINEVMTWGINSAKWEAAIAYCKEKDWDFLLLTERDINFVD